MKTDRDFYWSWEDAITESDLPALTRLVLLTLSTFMNAKNTSAYPSQDELARCSGMSRSSVFRHLQKAEAAGFIEVSKHGFAGQKWANNEYNAVIPCSEKVVSQRLDLLNEACVTETQRSGQSDIKLVSDRPTNTPINQQSISLAEEKIEFSVFWKAYPETTGQNPALSKNLWTEMLPADQLSALNSLPAYAAGTKTGTRSYPYVFLRDRVWEMFQHSNKPVPQGNPYEPNSVLWSLYQLITEKHGSPKAHSWFGPERASQVEGYPHLLIASTAFIATYWAENFLDTIKSLDLGIDVK